MSDKPKTIACDEGFKIAQLQSQVVELIKTLNRVEAEKAELENQLAAGIHTCTDTCQRPMCVLRRRVKELEDLQLTIYNAGYEKGNFDAVEGHYAPPIEYPEEFPEILEELEGE